MVIKQKKLGGFVAVCGVLLLALVFAAGCDQPVMLTKTSGTTGTTGTPGTTPTTPTSYDHDKRLHNGDYSMFCGLYKGGIGSVTVVDGDKRGGTLKGIVVSATKMTVKRDSTWSGSSDNGVTNPLTDDYTVPITWELFDFDSDGVLERGFISLKSNGTLIGGLIYTIRNGKAGQPRLYLGDNFYVYKTIWPSIRPRLPLPEGWTKINGEPEFTGGY